VLASSAASELGLSDDQVEASAIQNVTAMTNPGHMSKGVLNLQESDQPRFDLVLTIKHVDSADHASELARQEFGDTTKVQHLLNTAGIEGVVLEVREVEVMWVPIPTAPASIATPAPVPAPNDEPLVVSGGTNPATPSGTCGAWCELECATSDDQCCDGNPDCSACDFCIALADALADMRPARDASTGTPPSSSGTCEGWCESECATTDDLCCGGMPACSACNFCISLADALPNANERGLKILCLHGGGSSASEFQTEISGITHALPGFEFVFVNGGSPADNNVFVWIDDPSGDSTQEPAIDSASYMALDAVVADQGPFHAIMGYSQGGMYVSAYLAHVPAGTFQAAVIFCGYLPETHLGVLQRINDRAPLQTPAFLYIGANDQTITPAMTEEAATKYTSAQVIINSAGTHMPPLEGETGFSQVVAFITASSNNIANNEVEVALDLEAEASSTKLMSSSSSPASTKLTSSSSQKTSSPTPKDFIITVPDGIGPGEILSTVISGQEYHITVPTNLDKERRISISIPVA